MGRFSRRAPRFFVAILGLLLLLIVAGVSVSRPAFAQGDVTSTPVFTSPTTIEIPPPQLCDPKNPPLTPFSEAKVEQIDDLTARVTYTNSLDQIFTLTIRASASNADDLKRFLAETKLCLEAVPVTNYPPQGTGIDIPFGDTFIANLQSALESKDVSLADLVALRDKLGEDIADSDQDGPTLRYLFEQFKLDPSQVDTVAEDAASAAADLIDQAVKNGQLDANLASELKDEIKSWYVKGVDEPFAGIVPSGVAENVPPALDISLDLTDPGKVQSESGDYLIYALVDPTINYGWTQRHEWSLRSGAATYMYVSIYVTGGTISAYLYNGSQYKYQGAANVGGTMSSIHNWLATKWVLVGLKNVNSYNCSCYPLIRTR